MSDWRALYSVVLQLQERHALKRQPVLDAGASIYSVPRICSTLPTAKKNAKKWLRQLPFLNS
jgi:hypothetical protein